MPREKKKESRKKYQAWCVFRNEIFQKYGSLSPEELDAKIKEVPVNCLPATPNDMIPFFFPLPTVLA